MADILHLLNIKTNSEKVFDAITTREGLSNWWTTATEARPELGSIVTFRFRPSYYNEMKIVNLEKNEKVEWECIKGDPQWIGTKLIFNIESQNNATILRFFHTGWKEATDFFAACNYHWGLYLKSLKTYLETGKGNPHIY